MATSTPFSRRLYGRGSVLALLGVLHAGLIYALTSAHAAKPLSIVAVPIEVSFLADTTEPPPVPPPPRAARLPTVDIIMPVVDVNYLPPPPAAITITPMPVPTAATDIGPVAILEADFLRPPAPRYPPSARRARVEGTVLLRVLVDAEGRASDVKVYRSSGSLALDDAACDAVRGALFRPHRENGVARAALVTIPVEFSLKVRSASNDAYRGKRQARLDGADDGS